MKKWADASTRPEDGPREGDTRWVDADSYEAGMADPGLHEANRLAHAAVRATLRVRRVYAELPESVDELNHALIARDRSLDAYERAISGDGP